VKWSKRHEPSSKLAQAHNRPHSSPESNKVLRGKLHGTNRFQGPAQGAGPFSGVTLKRSTARVFTVTSLTGECVRIYPMPEWEAIEQRLSLLPSMDPAPAQVP
jgi:hypothetical protein